MFLVCNGILAFLSRSSSSFSSSSLPGSDLDGDDELFKKQDRSAFDESPEDAIKVSASESSEFEAVTAVNAATIGDKKCQENNLFLAAEEEEEEKLQAQGKDKEEEDEAEQQDEQMLQQTEFANTGVEEAEGNEIWVMEDDDRLSKIEEEEPEECGYLWKETELPAAATGSEEMMSTEELNKKFEEFIRKMKEEIRIEAKTQPIAV